MKKRIGDGMGRKTFFDVLERELNLQNEYEKIERLFLNDHVSFGYTLYDDIERDFKNWSLKKNYVSFYELRECLGFTYEYYDNAYNATGKINEVNDFFIYCEMILNLIKQVLPKEVYDYHEETINQILDIVYYDLEYLNYRFCTKSDGKLIIEQKDAAVTEVVDIVDPSLADSILEYNHYVLRGNIKEKKSILLRIINTLEPKLPELKKINGGLFGDYSYLINNMDLRHNNCDSNDEKKYNKKFSNLSDSEKEEWYDETFQMCLLMFLLLKHQDRKERINAMKRKDDVL